MARLTYLGLILALAGCSTTGGVKQPSGPELVAADKALVMPPPGGPAIVGVVQTSHSNGVEQTISLSTASHVPGQNYIKVSFNGGSDTGEQTRMGYRPISESGIRAEINRAAPGVALSRSSVYLQNTYGPFGYASGHTRSGDVCLYGWQQVRSRPTGNGIGRDFGMIQVRLRLCDNRATESELLSVLYGYTIVGSFQGEIWNPYGAPAPLDPRLGQVGQPIYPSPDPAARKIAFGFGTPDQTTTNAIPVSRSSVAGSVPAAAVAPSSAPMTGPAPDQSNVTTVRVPAPPGLDATSPAVGTPAVVVPSPVCLSATAMTASCTNKGGNGPAR